MLQSPFEFIVVGTPVSLQTKQRARLQHWKQTIKSAALSVWGSRTPVLHSVCLKIVYYHDEYAVGDVDNIIKPIQDALNTLVYADDSQVTDVVARKRRLDSAFVYHKISDTLLDALTLYNVNFLHVVVDQALEPSIIEP